MPFQESFAVIAGCRTRIMRKGTGSPVLYLHGASGAPDWLPFMDRLAERHEVIVPEHPGFGGSDSPEWLDTIGDLAYFYLDFIDHFELTGVHLIGASMGGWLGCEIAVRNCTSLRSLTLLAPAGLRDKNLRKADIFMMSPQDLIRHLFHDPALAEQMLAQPVTDQGIELGLKNRLAVAKLGWEPRLYNPHLHKWLHRISVPTLVLWGRQDRIIPEGYGRVFTDLIPGASLHVIDGCGHLPQVERPDETIGNFETFVGRIAA